MKHILCFSFYMLIQRCSFSQDYNYVVKFQEALSPTELKITLNDILLPIFSENNSILKLEISDDRTFLNVVTKQVLPLETVQYTLKQKYAIIIQEN